MSTLAATRRATTDRPLKGLILAAGLGSRLRPLTSERPKPLVPFLGTHALALAICRLKRAGIDEIAVNAHYRADQLVAYAQRTRLARLHVSHETPAILGTGGAFNPLRQWLGEADLVVVNGDIVSDIDIGQLLETHDVIGAVATMALLPEVIPGEKAVYHRHRQVVAIGGEPPCETAAGNFACAQLLANAFIKALPATGSFDIISCGYRPQLAKGAKIACYLHRGVWHDLRDPAHYHRAVMDGLRFVDDPYDRLGLAEVWQAEGGRPQLRAGGVVLERGCQLSGELDLCETVVWPGARLEGPMALRRALVLPDQVLEV